MHRLRDFLFLALFFVLIIGWVFAWAAFKLAGGMIHLLLVFAVVALVLHFIQGRRTI